MINVTMIMDHGLSVVMQVETWAHVYSKIDEECGSSLNRQKFVLAYASESEWNDSKGHYDVVRSETFAAPSVCARRSLRSFGPNMKLVADDGAPKLKRKW